MSKKRDAGEWIYGIYSISENLLQQYEKGQLQTQSGITLCRKSCAYYGYCGGGAPANKYYENGSFATAETMFCKYSVKLPLEIVLNDLEAGLGPTGGG